jgi:hypothetical protein
MILGRWSLYTEDGWVPVDLRLQVALPEWTYVQPLVWSGIMWLDTPPGGGGPLVAAAS